MNQKGRRRRTQAPARPSLLRIYKLLLAHGGPLGWWPGETPFEVCVGAILTQNTAWSNVERAIDVLKGRGLLSFDALTGLSAAEIAPHIRPSGYFNVKAGRLASFLRFLRDEYGGRVEAMRSEETGILRTKLLGVSGIGRETADSIVLYAAGRPLFVIDAYTRRIYARLGCVDGREPYDALQRYFMERLPMDVALYNDYHAQIVLLGKNHCRPRPRCEGCPLERFCPRIGVRQPERVRRGKVLKSSWKGASRFRRER